MSQQELTPEMRFFQVAQQEERLVKQLQEVEERAAPITRSFQAMAAATAGGARCHVNRGEGERCTFLVFRPGECISDKITCPTEREATTVIEERNQLASDLQNARKIKADLMAQIKRETAAD